MDEQREPELATLRTRVEAANLLGLAEAAEVFLGDDPATVARVLADWKEQDHGELPRLTTPCWVALAPIGAGLPPGEAPLVLDAMLRGAAVVEQAAADALRECRDRAERLPPAPALPAGGGDLLVELWRRALIAAIADFWAMVSEALARVRPALTQGDHAEATRLLAIEQPPVREAAERVEVLASRAAEIEREGEPERSGTPLPPVAPPATPEPAVETASGPGARARRETFHRWAPVVFLVVSTWLALGVLYAVLYR